MNIQFKQLSSWHLIINVENSVKSVEEGDGDKASGEGWKTSEATRPIYIKAV